MGRRALTSRDELRMSALRVARRAGAGAMTSRAVAAEAGIALGTMYRHVPDIAALLADAAEEVQASFVDVLTAAAPVDRPLRDCLPAMAAALVDRARAEPRLTELLAIPAPADSAGGGAAIRRWIAARAQLAAANGEVVVDDPDLLAAAAFGLVRSTLEQVLAHPELRDAAVALIAHGLSGLLAPDRPSSPG